MRRIYSHKDHNISTCTLSECLLNYESWCQQNCHVLFWRCTKNKEMCYSIGLSGPSFISSAAPVATTPTAAPLLHLSSLEVFSFPMDQTIKHVIITKMTPCPATPPSPTVLCHTKMSTLFLLATTSLRHAWLLQTEHVKINLDCVSLFSPCLEIRQ